MLSDSISLLTYFELRFTPVKNKKIISPVRLPLTLRKLHVNQDLISKERKVVVLN